MSSAHRPHEQLPPGESIWRGPPIDLSGIEGGLFEALLAIRRRRGGTTAILEDQSGETISYNTLVRRAYALGANLAKAIKPRETVGVLLPTGAPAAVVFFALQSVGRVPAMLNYYAGAESLKAACSLARARKVVTSRRFLRTAKLEGLVSKLQNSASFLYLEDIRNSIGVVDGAIAVLRSVLPMLRPVRVNPQDPAVILFTSGTTGEPKGVVLSHANLLANVAQCLAHVPFQPDWIFFNALPLFHAFGLTTGTLLPILGGMKTVLYPSPLDHERIPKAIEATGANVLISTDSFAQIYTRAAPGATLKGLRYVVLGAERVTETTEKLLAERTSAIVLPGYGATECSPVIAANQPNNARAGTVGKLLPGMEARLEPVPGITTGARLYVRGPNVMLGYLDEARPGLIVPPQSGWFDTGDITNVDKDGFITVTGRIKRFARIGAEMASLEAIEDNARSIWPSGHHAAVSIDLDGEGETIVLVTDEQSAERADFVLWAHTHEAGHFAIPSQILVVPKFPLLPTGKTDYPTIQRIIRERLGATIVSDQPSAHQASEEAPVRHMP